MQVGDATAKPDPCFAQLGVNRAFCSAACPNPFPSSGYRIGTSWLMPRALAADVM